MIRDPFNLACLMAARLKVEPIDLSPSLSRSNIEYWNLTLDGRLFLKHSLPNIPVSPTTDRPIPAVQP